MVGQPIPQALLGRLRSIDGSDYGAYQSLIGRYEYPDFELLITRIPKDPYAPPHTGIYQLRVNHNYLGIPTNLFDTQIAGTAYRDFLARKFSATAGQVSRRGRGTGHSGLITLDTPAQAILDRSAVVFTDTGVEVRFFIGLPANGRKVNAKIAQAMLLDELPNIVQLAFNELDKRAVKQHIAVAEDGECLRAQLDQLQLAAFIANGSLLPRSSGTDDRPMESNEAVSFHSPENLRVSVELPNVGIISGMGIPQGVTLLVGGGYHGKSTLLHAIESGIYNHIPNDGRENCVTDYRSVKVRAYSGRVVKSVDISSFIDNLPFGRDTVDFSTTNASGSTSQAVSIVEALELGAKVLLMDEDTCATNFMIRDSKMQALVHKSDEPITPFIDRVRWLYESRGVSTVLVQGGVGDYFEVADTVIQMLNYGPHDVTAAAKKIAENSQIRRAHEHPQLPSPLPQRLINTSSINSHNAHGKHSVFARETNCVNFGSNIIDLTDVEQLIEISQTKAIAQAILYLKNRHTDLVPINELIAECMLVVEEQGLDGLSDHISGHFAKFRDIELASALNRMGSLEVEQRQCKTDLNDV